MEKNMSDELTMEQMEHVSGGNSILRGLHVLAKKTGTYDFYYNLYKNLQDGQDFSEAAHCAGQTAGVPGMEDE